jgi:hypothetical protein
MPDLEGNPVDETEARAILRGGAGNQLMLAAASYVAVVFWSGVDASGRRHIMHNGSGFFVQIAGPPFFVTAAHVVRQLQKDSESQPGQVKVQVDDESIDLLASLIDIDDALDVATVRVPDGLPNAINKWIYRRSVERWPPPPPQEGRGLFFAGYPGAYRSELSRRHVEFGLYGGLLTATSVSQTSIVSQLDRGLAEALPGLSPPPANAWLGGMSGAPCWTLTQIGWRLAGVLYQYSQDYELFYFRSANAIRLDGRLSRLSQDTL